MLFEIYEAIKYGLLKLNYLLLNIMSFETFFVVQKY